MIQQIFTVPIYEVDLEDIDNEAIYNFLKSEEQKHIGEEGSDEYNNYYKKGREIYNVMYNIAFSSVLNFPNHLLKHQINQFPILANMFQNCNYSYELRLELRKFLF